MTIRVVVAEDSLLVREGIVKLLDAHDDRPAMTSFVFE